MNAAVMRKVFLIATIVGVVLVFGISQDTCNDVWAHALNGKVMMEKGRFPKFSDYSFVQGQDVAYNSNVLPALLFHFLLVSLGYPGLVLFKTLAIAITVSFMLLWLREEGVALKAGAYAVAGFVIVAQSRFLPRGDLLNIAFLSIYLYLLARHRRCRDRVIWILPILQVLWIQFHDLACLGIFAILAYAADGILHRLLLAKISHKSGDMGYQLFLLKLAGICFIASFFSPSSYHGALHPLYVLWEINSGRPELYSIIPEFYPILHFGQQISIPRWSVSIRYGISLALALTMLIVKRDRLNATHIILFIGLSAAAFRFIRFMGVYALVAVSLTIIYFWEWLGKKWKTSLFIYPGAIVLNILLIVWVATGYIYRMADVPLRCSLSICQDIKPIRTIDFIREQKFTGNVYCGYDVGGFVGYKLYPNCKIFIHSLTKWYSFQHFLYDTSVQRGQIDPLLMARDYPLDMFLLDNDRPYALSMMKSLDKSASWSLVYLDDANALYIRKESFPEQARKLHIDLDKFHFADNLVSTPFGFYRLGGLFMGLEKYDQAKVYYQKSLNYGLFRANTYNTLGVIAKRKGEYHKALEYFLKSAQLEKSDMALKNLKDSLEHFPQCDDNNCKKARKICREWKQ